VTFTPKIYFRILGLGLDNSGPVNIAAANAGVNSNVTRLYFAWIDGVSCLLIHVYLL